MKDVTYAVAKRNPEKIQAYQTLRTLTIQTLLQGSSPGKPEFFQACFIKYIETNVDDIFDQLVGFYITKTIILAQSPFGLEE